MLMHVISKDPFIKTMLQRASCGQKPHGAFNLYVHVLTSYCRPSSDDGSDGLFLPSVSEVSERHSLLLFGLIIAVILLYIHHHLSGHTCLQSPNNDNTENYNYSKMLNAEKCSN